MGRAEDGREDEDEAKDTGEEELGSEDWVGPTSKLWDTQNYDLYKNKSENFSPETLSRSPVCQANTRASIDIY